MPYIIDGNNVMATLSRDVIIARRRLIAALTRFIAVNRVSVTVVFDGVPDDEFPEDRRTKSVHILYARPGSDADTRIKELVRRASYKRDIVVVTSDKELGSFASHLGSRILTSHVFRDMLDECESVQMSREKAGYTPVDVKEWMDYFNLS